jgi:hypothetical protein
VSESFLHYLWQFQYFDKKELKTTAGEQLVIFNPGMLNGDAGPDFSQAKAKIDGIDWVGNVEIHIQSSGWMDHGHHQDQAYENVVLHVVWTEDKPVYRKDGSRIPTLELKARVDEQLIGAYNKLIKQPSIIPCEHSFRNIDNLVKLSMVDKALMKRLEDKAKRVNVLLAQNNGDWEETAYQLLAANFGFKVNKEPFVLLAKVLPYKIIQKHRDQLLQIEALLFGQAGFLIAKTKDEYITNLYNEYSFLSKKYSLSSSRMNPAQWKYLRLRPANFPTLRIAQFASMLQSQKSIFSQLIEAVGYKDLQRFFEITTSSYWQSHYRFGKKAEGIVPSFGESSADIVIINSVVPLLVAYGKAKDDWSLVDKAVNILQQIPVEKNKIVTVWKNLGYSGKTAFDSQGLIELYENFCQQRQCLNCAIGSSILKPATLHR